MKKIIFQGLTIVVENPAGSIRQGKDSVTGKPWKVTMPFPYGYFAKTEGVDGDEVDVFVGPNKHAKFAYVIHQLDKNSGKFDEDKVMLGWDDAMEAKEAYFKSYDLPEQFYGTVETIKMEDLKAKLKQTKEEPAMIHAATKMNKTIALYADAVTHEAITKGSQVTVDGEHGRGIVTAVNGRRVNVTFRHGVTLSRDIMFVHNIADRQKKMWSDKMEAGGTGSGRHPELYHVTHTKYVAKIQKEGLKPMQTSNWIQKGDSSRYGNGEVHTFTDKADALRWAAKMDWGFNREVGSGKVSILKLSPGDEKWKIDEGDPLSHAGAKGDWLKYMGHISGDRVISAEPFTHDQARELTQSMRGAEEQVELEGNPIRQQHKTGKWIEKVGTQFCIRSNEVDKNLGCWPSKEKAEAVMAGKSFIEPDVMQAGKKKKLKSASGLPQTGWQYGKRTMPVGYIPKKTLSGFPTAKKAGTGHRLPNPSGTSGIKVRKPNPGMLSYADLGEPMAGALQHAHLDSNMFFHPPSLLKRNKETHVPTDDPGEKNDRFLDVTKRNQAHKDRMKILKRSSPGNTLIPAHTTLLAPHQGSLGSGVLTASARRRRRNGGMYRAYGAAKI